MAQVAQLTNAAYTKAMGYLTLDDEGVVTITGGDEAQVDACAARIAELVDLGR